MSFAITSVTVCKLRQRPNAAGRACVVVGKPFDGLLLWEPKVGDRLVICRSGSNHLTTTPVKRLLLESDGKSVYIETTNSVYRLTFGMAISRVEQGRLVFAPPHNVPRAVDGEEITGVADDSPAQEPLSHPKSNH
jgi:hypothetical protein